MLTVSLKRHQDKKTYNYYNTYIANMRIEVQDINDKTRYEVTLFECYPKTISSIQMDYAAKDVMKISIGMQYKNWIATPKSPLADGQKVPTNLLLVGASNVPSVDLANAEVVAD
jgi:hypothetical protein